MIYPVICCIAMICTPDVYYLYVRTPAHVHYLYVYITENILSMYVRTPRTLVWNLSPAIELTCFKLPDTLL